jgi:hypothetical protein
VTRKLLLLVKASNVTQLTLREAAMAEGRVPTQAVGHQVQQDPATCFVVKCTKACMQQANKQRFGSPYLHVHLQPHVGQQHRAWPLAAPLAQGQAGQHQLHQHQH